MGQSEVLEFLERNKQPVAAREIAKSLDENLSKIVEILRKLIYHNEVKFLELDRKVAKKYFNSNRRMKLYYSTDININLKEVLSMLESLFS